MKIATIKKKHRNEWVLVEVVKEDTLNQPIEGNVIAHGKDRDAIYEKMKKLPEGFRVATFYTGKIPPKDMAFAF